MTEDCARVARLGDLRGLCVSTDEEFCHQNPIASRKTPDFCGHPRRFTPRIADDFNRGRRSIPSFAPKNRFRLFATKLAAVLEGKNRTLARAG
jgi:hypothetical protein